MKVLLLLLVAGALQANPDGLVWIHAEGQFTMQQDRRNLENVTFMDFDPVTMNLVNLGRGRVRYLSGERAGAVRGTLALHSGLSLGLGLQHSRTEMTLTGEVYGSARVFGLEYSYLDQWGPSAVLTLYPGAYVTGSDIGEAGSNPDGWLYWPSLQVSAGRLWTFQGEPYAHQNGQRRLLAVNVDLPLATFVTLEGGVRHGYEWSYLDGIPLFYPMSPIRDDEEQSLGLRFYWGGDAEAGLWHPHLGAPGAWRLNLRGARELQYRPQGAWLSRTTWTLAVQHALPWNVALSLGYKHHVIQQVEPSPIWAIHTQPHRHDLNAALSWAFNP